MSSQPWWWEITELHYACACPPCEGARRLRAERRRAGIAWRRRQVLRVRREWRRLWTAQTGWRANLAVTAGSVFALTVGWTFLWSLHAMGMAA